MVRAARALALSGLVAGLVVIATSDPASAAATVTSSGTVVTVTATGDTSIGFTCDGSGAFYAAGVKATPTVACSAVTRVNVEGGTGAQTVSGGDLNQDRFTANPYLVANLSVGEDRLVETDRADTIDMGPGDDTVFIQAGGLDNVSVSLGTGTGDIAYFNGTDGDDTITGASTGTDVAGSVSTSEGGSTRTVKNVDMLFLKGNGGDDTLSASGVTAGSSVTNINMLGGTGDDTITAGPRPGSFYGNEGTNTFIGGTADATYTSWSDTDTIHAGATPDTVEVNDMTSGRSGGRTITGAGAWRYTQLQEGCLAESRIRPAVSGTRIISSLCRPGIQALPATLGRISLTLDGPGTTRSLADVVIPGTQKVAVAGTDTGRQLLDVTVPTGSWIASAPGPDGTITPTDATWGAVTYKDIDDLSVHGPWTDKNQGFAHRIVRDLLLRFPTAGERDAVRDALANGTRTRSQIVGSTMNTDEYRGNDVDRVFVRFLGRAPDPSGRTYWINALRNGRSLQKFRAQLFGSPEYFTKAGSTNAGFVRRAYFDVLGRLPDPSGEAYWVGKINAGLGRGSVANAFLASTEARRAIVKDQFQRFALRLPTSTESDQWVTKLAQPTGETDLIALLAASATYYDAG